MTNNALEAAIKYLSLGWRCIPINPEDKSALVKWKTGTKGTVDQLKEWWTQWPNAMVAVLTGPASGLLVVDVDTVEGGHQDGMATLRALQAQYGPLNGTLEARTPSGGIHLYYAWPDLEESVTIPTKANALGPGVDIKSRGGYVILPPSIRADGKPYEWVDESEVVEIPNDWLVERITKRIRDNPPESSKAEATFEDVARFVEELTRTPPAIEGSGGDTHTFQTCCRAAVDYKLTREQFLTAIADWNKRCSPPWTEDELLQKFENAKKYATGQPGAALVDRHDVDEQINNDPFAQFGIAAIGNNPATFAPVEHIPTGIEAIDDRINGLGGLRSKSVTLICGKPGEGKSTVAVQIAANAAAEGCPVGIISAELDSTDVFRLVAAQHSRIPRWKLETNKVTNSEAGDYRRTKEAIDGWPLHILDSNAWIGALDRNKLRSVVAKGVEAYGWKLVVLDYLGLLAPVSGENSFETDLENSTAIKYLARDFDIALLVVSAMRKSANFAKPTKSKGAPSLDEVTGAARIGYDAANAFYIQSNLDKHRPDRGLLELWCQKSRYSGLAKTDKVITLTWHPYSGAVTDKLNYAHGDDYAA